MPGEWAAAEGGAAAAAGARGAAALGAPAVPGRRGDREAADRREGREAVGRQEGRGDEAGPTGHRGARGEGVQLEAHQVGCWKEDRSSILRFSFSILHIKRE